MCKGVILLYSEGTSPTSNNGEFLDLNLHNRSYYATLFNHPSLTSFLNHPKVQAPFPLFNLKG